MKSEYLPNPLNGDSWEELCHDCYRLKYQDQHYQKIEASHGGDTGIEGFTKTGIVIQCYCLEKEYDQETTYEKMRNKITTDIGKLLMDKNIKRQNEFGLKVIKEWHFVTPFCDDSRILQHLETQKNRVLKRKEECSGCSNLDENALYNHFADDFTVVLKIADDFKPQIYCLQMNDYMNYKIDFTKDKNREISFEKCDSEKVANVKRKVEAIMNTEESDRSNKMVNYYMIAYLDGISILEDLRENFGDLYLSLIKLRNSYKNKAMRISTMNIDVKRNGSIFENIMEEFEEKIQKNFSNILSDNAVCELCLDIIAGWLADCTMDFIGVQGE